MKSKRAGIAEAVATLEMKMRHASCAVRGGSQFGIAQKYARRQLNLV